AAPVQRLVVVVERELGLAREDARDDGPPAAAADVELGAERRDQQTDRRDGPQQGDEDREERRPRRAELALGGDRALLEPGELAGTAGPLELRLGGEVGVRDDRGDRRAGHRISSARRICRTL